MLEELVERTREDCFLLSYTSCTQGQLVQLSESNSDGVPGMECFRLLMGRDICCERFLKKPKFLVLIKFDVAVSGVIPSLTKTVPQQGQRSECPSLPIGLEKVSRYPPLH